MSQTQLAARMRVPIQRVNQICTGRRAITPDSALPLSRLFGTTAEFWLNAQLARDLWHAAHSEKAAEIGRLEPILTSS